MAAAFAGGYGYGRWYAKPRPAGNAERSIAFWVDPMHPWYKSDKPGIAPDCGMKLVPVYRGEEGRSYESEKRSPGRHRRNHAGKQQPIGAQMAPPETRLRRIPSTRRPANAG